MLSIISSFFLHFSIYVSNLGMNYNNVIGFLLVFVFVIQFVTGLLLSCYYCSYIAFDSMIYMLLDVNIGWFIRFIHVMGVSLFILFINIHLMSGIWMKINIIYLNYAVNTVWATGFLLFLTMLFEGFMGYMLLWGQMSYWGITVILNVLSMMPVFGLVIITLIWCSSHIILFRIFIIHFVLAFMMGFLILFHIFIIHSFSNSNPFISSNSSIIVPFYPLIFKDLFSLFSSVMYTLSFMLLSDPDMLGNSDNLMLANSLLTPSNMLPEWYFLCLYGCLSGFPNKTMGFSIVLVFFLFIFIF